MRRKRLSPAWRHPPRAQSQSRGPEAVHVLRGHRDHDPIHPVHGSISRRPSSLGYEEEIVTKAIFTDDALIYYLCVVDTLDGVTNESGAW